ncbi:hypothetical protein BDW66DRAFT_102931 [Aspergillus desertorum]
MNLLRSSSRRSNMRTIPLYIIRTCITANQLHSHPVQLQTGLMDSPLRSGPNSSRIHQIATMVMVKCTPYPMIVHLSMVILVVIVRAHDPITWHGWNVYHMHR